MRITTLSILLSAIALCACSSKKNISQGNRVDSTSLTKSSLLAWSNHVDTAFRSLAIELDSIDITAEPTILHACHDADSIRPPVLAYRLHMRANRAAAKQSGTFASHSTSGMRMTDTTARHVETECATVKSVNTIVGASPPNLTLIFFIVICFCCLCYYLYKVKK